MELDQRLGQLSVFYVHIAIMAMFENAGMIRSNWDECCVIILSIAVFLLLAIVDIGKLIDESEDEDSWINDK